MKKETTSLCPVCSNTISAVKYKQGKDVFLEKECPDHGVFKTQIAKDSKRFFDKTFDVAGKPFCPTVSFKGSCGKDCGWCEKHKQHICTGLIEITDMCNMACPICYFGNKGKTSISLEEYKDRFKTLLTVEQGYLDVLQISGGECLLHPDFEEIILWTLTQPVSRILINTNGLKLLEDDSLFEFVAAYKDRIEIYLQFDGFDEAVYQQLRGRPLLNEKQMLIDRLNQAEIKICLAVTVYQENLSQIPDILQLATRIKHISGITFQRLTKVGSAIKTSLQSVLQEDILLAIAQSGLMRYQDMIPLPCSHENCTSLGFLFCTKDNVYSLGDYIDFTKCKTVLSNKIAFDKTILDYMQKNVCNCFVGKMLGSSFLLDKLKDFASGGQSTHHEMKIIRVLVKNFMDTDTFDFERAQKCCTGVSVGNGKVIPFCIHNALKGKVKW